MSRLGRPLLLLVCLLVLDFALPRLLPGDPLAAPSSGGGQDSAGALTPEARARLLAYYDLDRPLPEQFGRFLLATAHGDLGFSIAFNQPVGALIARRVGWTLFLTGDALRHAALPGLTLTLAHLPAFYLLMRGAARQELDGGYVTVARAKGLREPRVALGHVLRNALPPTLALLGVRVGLLLGGAVVVETVFAYPGLGYLTFQAIGARDYPLLQALFLLSGLAVLVANLGSDLLLRRVDPRRVDAG